MQPWVGRYGGSAACPRRNVWRMQPVGTLPQEVVGYTNNAQILFQKRKVTTNSVQTMARVVSHRKSQPLEHSCTHRGRHPCHLCLRICVGRKWCERSILPGNNGTWSIVESFSVFRAVVDALSELCQLRHTRSTAVLDAFSKARRL